MACLPCVHRQARRGRCCASTCGLARCLMLAVGVVLGAQVSAADAPTAPVPATSAPHPQQPAAAVTPTPATLPGLALPAPFLGVTLDHPTGFDADQGLLVTGVVSKSTFDHLGVRVGEHVLTVNGTTMNTVADFSLIAERLTIGQVITLRVRSDDALRTISGVVEAVSRPREISQKTQQLANEVEDLRTAVEGANTHPSMQQSLVLLKQLEADLPGMVDAFHQRYPQGQFDISIHIDILSDRSAKNPQPIAIPALPASGAAVSPSPGAVPATHPAPAPAPATPAPTH